MSDKTEDRKEQRNERLTTSAFADVEHRETRNRETRSGGNANETASVAAADEQSAPLFTQIETKTFRSRWDEIQVGFVDEPRRCVEQADNLVAMAIKRLAEMFAEEREKLEKQWDRGDDVSTEDLRLALRRYRSFFNRLLTM